MKNKYKVGELLEARSSCIIDINNFNSSSAGDREEEVKAGQLFLIIDVGPRNKKDISDIGYTLLCQKSATSSFWCQLDDDEDLDTLMENNFNKVIK